MFSTLLATLPLVAPSPAHAEPSDARRLSWTREAGAEACIGEEDLRRKIADMLGRDAFADAGGPAVSGVVRREGDSLVATLASRLPGEVPTSREFRTGAADCAPLTDAVILAIALSVERAPAAPSVEPAHPVLAQPAPFAPLRTEQTTAAERGRSDTLVALGHAQWTLGWLPRPTTGVGLALRYKVVERITIAAGGLWLPAASERGQFSVGLTAARVGGCVETVRAARVALVNCAYGLGGAMGVQNEAGNVSDAGTHPWFAGSITAAAMARFGETWVAEAGVEGAVPLARPTYATASCPMVGFQQPAATLGIFLSLGTFFL